MCGHLRPGARRRQFLSVVRGPKLTAGDDDVLIRRNPHSLQRASQVVASMLRIGLRPQQVRQPVSRAAELAAEREPGERRLRTTLRQAGNRSARLFVESETTQQPKREHILAENLRDRDAGGAGNGRYHHRAIGGRGKRPR